jgi:beta-xylosidase
MKHLLFAGLLAGALPLAAVAQKALPKPTAARAGNPVFPGWYADPEAVIFDKTYWIYPTYSAVFDEQVYLDAFSSPDLVHWTKHPRIIDTASVKWARRALWAPAVVRRDGQYFLFFGANDVHQGEVGGIGVAVSERPEGPFRDYLGKPLVGTIENGAQPIDQYVFRDTDGQYYLFYGGWSHCNVARLKPDFTGLLPFADGSTFKEITPAHYTEGPTMFRRGGRYYFMWSEGDWGKAEYSVAYAVADSPLGPFRRVGKVLQQDAAVATGAGHHSVLQIPGTEEWYIVYHRRPLDDTGRDHRVTCIDQLEFDAQGLIRPVKITRQGVAARKL